MLYIGLADFAEPTLLILGDAESLNWLADCLEARQSIDLAKTPSVTLVNVGLAISPAEGEGHLNRHDAQFDWKVSSSEAQLFSEQLRALTASGRPAHAYLDTQANNASVQVIASQGEYSANAVFTR